MKKNHTHKHTQTCYLITAEDEHGDVWIKPGDPLLGAWYPANPNMDISRIAFSNEVRAKEEWAKLQDLEELNHTLPDGSVVVFNSLDYRAFDKVRQ